MNSRLSESQLANLVRLFTAELDTLELESPLPEESEPSFTSRVLRPWLEDWTAALRRPDLIVRGDGGLNPPRALVVGSLTFYPDVEIVAAGHRYLAIEVKFLRAGHDPTGAFAKALGQAALYRELGFASSHALILDLRPSSGGTLPPVPRWEQLGEVGIHVHWFRKQATPSASTLRRFAP
jgi:hypothetical protein